MVNRVERDSAVDWMRSVSIMLIVLSHFLMFGGNGDSMIWLGHYLGDVFSIVFICISALLYGLKWASNGYKPFPVKSFLTKRFIKIAASLYPYLIALICLYACFFMPIPIRKFVSNFLFLCWFDKIPTNGHLWFITMIWICYCSLCLSSRILKRGKAKLGLLCFFLAGAVTMHLILDKYNLPGYMFLLLFIYIMLFLYAPIKDKMYSKLDEHSSQSIYLFSIILVLFILVNSFTLYWMSMTEYDARDSKFWYMLTLCGLSWIVFFHMLFHSIKPNFIVSFLSKISFELYLVHHILCCGPFSVIETFENPIANFALLAFVSFILAYFLHIISGRALKCINN
jgi:peptidoglycan/LPS O-acetylase OafA/YrhL